MTRSYHGKKARAFGKDQALSRPLKRPVQARSRFTVQAIYDGLVRITVRHGWEDVTMRSLALETGYAVGTLYEYFPDREAVLSGYVRYAMEARYDAIAKAAVHDVPPRSRIEKMVMATLGLNASDLPVLLPDFIAHEPLIAGAADHARVFTELVSCWGKAFSTIPAFRNVPGETIQSVVLVLWGMFRYALLVDPKTLSDTVRMADMTEVIFGLIAPHLSNSADA